MVTAEDIKKIGKRVEKIKVAGIEAKTEQREVLKNLEHLVEEIEASSVSDEAKADFKEYIENSIKSIKESGKMLDVNVFKTHYEALEAEASALHEKAKVMLEGMEG